LEIMRKAVSLLFALAVWSSAANLSLVENRAPRGQEF